jgi:hypothetical protein
MAICGKTRKEDRTITHAHRDLTWFGLIPTSTERRGNFTSSRGNTTTCGGENTTISLSLPYSGPPRSNPRFPEGNLFTKHTPQIEPQSTLEDPPCSREEHLNALSLV